MSYERMAYVYDLLMADVPYDKWLQFVKSKQEQFQSTGRHVLDLACGTGELSVRLAKQGYTVTGVDLSEDMLFVAREKSDREGVDVQLYQQDMSALEGLGRYHLITIFCDSLNYLSDPEAVKSTFLHVYHHLDDEGLFLFDVHSPFQLQNRFINQSFTLTEEDIAYIWNCYEGEHPLSVEHDLSFFVLDEESGKYDRFDELHMQRTYPIANYKNWLDQAGFTILDITADFLDEAPNETSERIFFTCKKRTQCKDN